MSLRFMIRLRSRSRSRTAVSAAITSSKQPDKPARRARFHTSAPSQPGLCFRREAGEPGPACTARAARPVLFWATFELPVGDIDIAQRIECGG